MAAPGVPTTARPLHRPLLVALSAAVIIVIGALTVIVGILAALGLGILFGLIGGLGGFLVGAAIGAVYIIVGGILLIAGLGLWRMRSWAWWLSMLVAVVGLVASLNDEGYLGKVLWGFLVVYLIAVRRHFNQ